MIQNLLFWVHFLKNSSLVFLTLLTLLTSGKPVCWENSDKYVKDEFRLLYIFFIHS